MFSVAIVYISEIYTVNWSVTTSLDKRRYTSKLVIGETSIQPTALYHNRTSTELLLTCEI